MRICFYLILLLFPLLGSASEWKIEAWQQQQLMLSRPYDELDSQQEYMVVVDSPAPPQAMLNLMLDHKVFADWMLYGEEARVVAQPSINTYQMHTLMDAPWPLLGRDLVTESYYWQESGGWWLEVKSQPELISTITTHLRVKQMQTCWAALPSEKGSRIYYLGYLVDPGDVPEFVINEARKSVLLDSLKEFVRLSQQEEYEETPASQLSSAPQGWEYCKRLKTAVQEPKLVRLLSQ